MPVGWTRSIVTVSAAWPGPRRAPGVARLMCSGRTPKISAPSAMRRGRGLRLRQRQAAAVVEGDARVRAVPHQPARNEVHARRAEEPGDEARRRPLEQIERRALLLDHAVAHQHDPVGERHRLDLVVRDVDHRGGDLLMQPLDLDAHLVAELRVEVGERLVEQEELRVAHDGAADGDALALAAGKLARIAVEERR